MIISPDEQPTIKKIKHTRSSRFVDDYLDNLSRSEMKTLLGDIFEQFFIKTKSVIVNKEWNGVSTIDKGEKHDITN